MGYIPGITNNMFFQVCLKMVSISPKWPFTIGNISIDHWILERPGLDDLQRSHRFLDRTIHQTTVLSDMYAHINMFMFFYLSIINTQNTYMYDYNINIYDYIYIAIQIDLCRTFVGRYSNSTCFEHITCPVSAVLHGGWSHYFWWLKIEDLVDVYWV